MGFGLPWGLSQGSHSTPCVAANPTSPSVFPLSLKSADQAGHVVVGCLIQGFFPAEPMKVTWTGEGGSTKNFPPMLAASGGLYSMTSQLTLPADQCPADATKTCHVQHNSNFNKDVKVRCKGQRLAGRRGPPCSRSGTMFPTTAPFRHECIAGFSPQQVAWRGPPTGAGWNGGQAGSGVLTGGLSLRST